MRYRAAWVLPIAGPPIQGGWVRVENGRIGDVGPHRDAAPDEQPGDVNLGHAAILPGLVNAHTHLELSWMRGQIPPVTRFPDWIRHLIGLRDGPHEPTDQEARPAIDAAIDEAHRCGTALIGDISNTMASAAPLAASPLSAVVFKELIGFRSATASRLVAGALKDLEAAPLSARVRYALAAHAPYSVSPALFAAIRAAIDTGGLGPSSVHLGESVEEVEFLEHGTGAWRELLERMGAWDASWTVPGCGPTEYLQRLGFLDSRLLVVHGVQLRGPALRQLADAGATLVTCPRGNALTGAGEPPVAAFYGSGARVAVGTDSLASVPDLNLFSELAELRRLGPDVPARAIVASATINGARALGFENELGSIEPGKQSALIAVALPHGVSDPEEYLLSGIPASQIRWLDGPGRVGEPPTGA